MKNHHQTKKCSYKILRVGTHYATRVAATCGGDFLQRQLASCVLETFCENLCGCNRILSPQQVAQFFFFATCCSDKILSQRQRFSQKVSSTHSPSIRRFGGKGERWKRKRERAPLPPPPSKISSPLAPSDIWVQLVTRPVHTE